MIEEQKNVFFYITVMNENYVQLLGSGTILREAARLLREHHNRLHPEQTT